MLDLDDPELVSIELLPVSPETKTVEARAPVTLSEVELSIWFRSLVYWSLMSAGSTVHLLSDELDRLLRQLLYVPKPDGGEWHELLPMEWSYADHGTNFIRRLAGIDASHVSGTVAYRFRKRASRLLCVQETSRDLLIYLTEARPSWRRKDAAHRQGPD